MVELRQYELGLQVCGSPLEKKYSRGDIAVTLENPSPAVSILCSVIAKETGFFNVFERVGGKKKKLDVVYNGLPQNISRNFALDTFRALKSFACEDAGFGILTSAISGQFDEADISSLHSIFGSDSEISRIVLSRGTITNGVILEASQILYGRAYRQLKAFRDQKQARLESAMNDIQKTVASMNGHDKQSELPMVFVNPTDRTDDNWI
jgi:hypothetical protein